MTQAARLDGAPRRGRPGHDLESVLAVAVGAFNERGYDGTSMRDLAGRLGIAKSAIYHHVTGKEELLSLALDRALTGLSAVADRARALDAPAIGRLEYLVRGSVEVLEAESPYVTLLLRVRGNTSGRAGRPGPAARLRPVRGRPGPAGPARRRHRPGP